MKCPICNKPSHVKEVRDTKNESRRRTRECSNGHSFRSYELSEERHAELLDYEKAFYKIQVVMQTYDE